MCRVYRDNTPITENETHKDMEHEMLTRLAQGQYSHGVQPPTPVNITYSPLSCTMKTVGISSIKVDGNCDSKGRGLIGPSRFEHASCGSSQLLQGRHRLGAHPLVTTRDNGNFIWVSTRV